MKKRILLLVATILGSVASSHAVVFMSLSPKLQPGELGGAFYQAWDSRGLPVESGVPVNLLPHGYRPEDFVLETTDVLISEEF